MIANKQNQLSSDTTYAWLPYLIELRRRLIQCVVIILLIFAVLVYFAHPLYHAIALPLLKQLPPESHLIATTVTSPFFVPIRLALLLSCVIAMPLFLYHTWAFIMPALYKHERVLILPLMFASTLLFYCGISFAYFLVLPLLFKFFISVLPPQVIMMAEISTYLSFFIRSTVLLGLAFEIPVIIWLLVKSRAVTIQQLTQQRRYVIVLAFLIGMLLSPDVISQTLLALPIWLLFEGGIILARLQNIKN